MDMDIAKAKIVDLIDHNGKRRSFLDISKPDSILLVYCDDAEGRLEGYVFEAPDNEIRPLKLFALQYKSERRRKDSATGDLAKPSDN